MSLQFNLGTDGVNFQDIWFFSDEIDLSTIYTNDIAAVLSNYGVEAARAAIMQEIASVFGVYGINVDPRHLSLIADYMVCYFFSLTILMSEIHEFIFFFKKNQQQLMKFKIIDI